MVVLSYPYPIIWVIYYYFAVLSTAFEAIKEEEEKKKKIRFRPDVRELSECIAMAITFATIQNQRNGEIHGSPTIRIHPAGFDIVVYNPEFDVLLMSHFGWTRKALLILWIVVHYNIFPITHACMKDLQKYPCGYHCFAEQFASLPKASYQYGVSMELPEPCHESYFRDTLDFTFQLYGSRILES